MPERVLRIILITIIALQCVLHFVIPLMPHYLNDPAWYYMFNSWLFEGIWINEELYPSFHSPVLYYCSLGYPLPLYISEMLSRLSGLSFAFIVLQLQFFCYLFSARLIWLICKDWLNNRSVYCVVILYLCFLPFFNYAHLLMSESWFIFCLLIVIYFFKKALHSEKKFLPLACFFLAGYLFLVRPVAGVLFPILLFIFFLHPPKTFSKSHILIVSLCFFIFPLFQSLFNKALFSTWKPRQGFAWNLWNRVVAEDGYDPNLSETTMGLGKKLGDSTFRAAGPHWWDITSQLSAKGMRQGEIEDYCLKVCIDGIKADKLKYIGSTLKNGFWTLPTGEQNTVLIFSSSGQYSDFLRAYESKQHAPLVNALSLQNFGRNNLKSLLLKCYRGWEKIFQLLSYRFVHIIIYIISLLNASLSLYNYYRYKKPDPLLFFLFSICLGMSFASCAFEVVHFRYYLPSFLLELMMAPYLLNLISRQKSSV